MREKIESGFSWLVMEKIFMSSPQVLNYKYGMWIFLGLISEGWGREFSWFSLWVKVWVLGDFYEIK